MQTIEVINLIDVILAATLTPEEVKVWWSTRQESINNQSPRAYLHDNDQGGVDSHIVDTLMLLAEVA
jgi:hypothetical protein